MPNQRSSLVSDPGPTSGTPHEPARRDRPLIDLVHREHVTDVVVLHHAAHNARRRDDRQPHLGACPPAGTTWQWSTHKPTRPARAPRSSSTITFSALNSVRHAASPSRTSGRFAVGPSGRSLTSTPYPTLPNNRRRTTARKIHGQEQRVDRPRPFRDDCQPKPNSSAIDCVVGHSATPFAQDR